MQINLSKIVLFLAFSVFLTHDVLPHIHFDDHAEHSTEHKAPDTEQDHLILEHHIDENFTGNKEIIVQDLNSSIILFYISAPLHNQLSEKQFTFDRYRSNYISFHSLRVSKDRAPPVS